MQDDQDFAPLSGPGTGLLTVHQRLPTSGARTALPFRLDGELLLAVPQLAEDKPDEAPHMNGGNSDIDAIFYRWSDGAFAEHDRLPVTGGEDVLLFTIGEDSFLATASVRTGSGPYELNATSTVYRREEGNWVAFQQFATFAAKQWHYFSFDDRHFLALAQGVTLPHAVPTGPRESCIYEWTGEGFELFQTLDGGWGYNFRYYEIEDTGYLAYADHTSPSIIYRWQGGRFQSFQTIASHGGRAYSQFEAEGEQWLVFAAIDGLSILFRWDGIRWVEHQPIGGPGGREFALIRGGDALYLARICFIEGTPAAPKTDLLSDLYRWTGDGFERIAQFPTYGGTDAEAFEVDGKHFLAVSNSLTPDIRFRQDMVIYQIAL